jgi:hypothetical protein
MVSKETAATFRYLVGSWAETSVYATEKGVCFRMKGLHLHVLCVDQKQHV